MQKFLLSLITLFATSAFAGERVIINPDYQGDVKIKVQTTGGGSPGTTVDAITVTGSTGAVTVGASGGTQTHQFNGNGLYLLAPGAALSTIESTGSNSATLRFKNGGATHWDLYDAVAASNMFKFDYSGATKGSVESDGSWVLGPAAATTQRQRINGSLSLEGTAGIFGLSIGASATTPEARCQASASAKGFSASAVGTCLAAWNSSSSPFPKITCGDTATTAKVILCAGAYP